jgi:formate hydrogenlyase subunit 4
MPNLNKFVLGSIFIALFIFITIDKQTGIFAAVLSLLLFLFNFLPITHENKPSSKVKADNKSDLD